MEGTILVSKGDLNSEKQDVETELRRFAEQVLYNYWSTIKNYKSRHFKETIDKIFCIF